MLQKCQTCHCHYPTHPMSSEQTSRRLCEEEFNYVDKDTGQCHECPPVMRPVLIFLAYAGATGLVLFLLYVLLYQSWRVIKFPARAVRWVTMAHAHSFGQQGPAKFRVWPADCHPPSFMCPGCQHVEAPRTNPQPPTTPVS